MNKFSPLLQKASLLCFAFAALTITSCDSDDDGAAQNNFQYFPLEVANSWFYDVDTEGVVVTDALEVTSSTGNSFELTATPAIANALMTGVLSNGTLTAENGKLSGTGSLNFGFQGIDDLNIEVNNAALYDQNAAVNATLSTTTGSASQSLQGIIIDINYTATTVQQATMNSMVVDGTTYTDVLHSQLIVNASIGSPITVAGFTTVISVMPAQNVFVVDNYWAKDIGLIQSDSQFSYQLADLSALPVTLPIPVSQDILTVQTLTGYVVN
jgi:hypothetical protein